MTSALFDAWIDFSRANERLQQFGQSDDESTFNGATGCTHTILQRLIKAKTGRYYSHDEISQIATYPWPSNNPNKRGMYSGGSDDEVGRVVRQFGLPYRLVVGGSYESWRHLIPNGNAERGPVIIQIVYGWWPEDQGYVYGRIHADGRPNGYASKNGKTQLSGAERIFHATLAIGARKKPDSTTYYGYANEPNHGSPARPERPAYDRVTTGQMKRAYERPQIEGRRLMAWVPTTRFRPKGY